MQSVLVVAEHDESVLAVGTLNAIGAALALEPASIDVAVLARDGARIAEQAATVAGVTRVLRLDRPENSPCLAAIWAPQLAQLAADYTHVLAPATTFGKDVLPRAAALAGVPALSDISAIDAPDRFQRPIFAGNLIETRDTTEADHPLFATIRTTAFPAPGPQGAATIERRALDLELPTHTRFIERRRDSQAGPDLQSAQTVVAGGRGLGGAEGVRLLEALASVLGAAVGASRAAVDSGWMGNELQVGQTGKIVAPRLYLAIGISGAIQHLTGIKDAGTIVAINRDPDAPICALADLVLTEDLFTAVPTLIERLQRGDET